MAILQDLRAENERLRREIEASKAQTLRMKVSEKGGLSVYGLGRWPVTLYRGQWERLLDHKDALLAFIESNADRLSTKE
jgi:hypothetical protein